LNIIMAIETVNIHIASYYVGSSSITNPLLFVFVDGVSAPGNILIQSAGLSRRYIYPRVSNGSVYISEISYVYGTELPPINKTIKILIGESK